MAISSPVRLAAASNDSWRFECSLDTAKMAPNWGKHQVSQGWESRLGSIYSRRGLNSRAGDLR